MNVKPRAIGILGGSFDPVHNGHIAIAKSFLKSGFISSLHVLLNPLPPHKPDAELAPYAIRLQMLREAFKPVDNTIVSDLEDHLPKPTYTIQTINYLIKAHPQTTFYLCMGKDSFLSFKKWYKWREILKKCSLLIAERPALAKKNRDNDLLKRATFIDHQPVDISSTEIRELIAEGKCVDHMLPPAVLKIIKVNTLYKSI